MRLHCLGTTGYHPSPSRHTACYYVPGLSLILDAGSGIFRLTDLLLQEPKKILTILLSHAHLDHIVGLTYLIDILAQTRLERVVIIGEQEKLSAIQQHLFQTLIFPLLPEALEFRPLPSERGQLQAPEFDLTYFPLEHPGGSIGFRITHEDENPKVAKNLAYVTDTVARPDAAYLKYIQQADLLLHECYFRDEEQVLAERTGHSWLAGVSEIVRRTRPVQTALIHLNPLAEQLGNPVILSDEHRDKLKMSIAEDGQIYEY